MALIAIVRSPFSPQDAEKYVLDSPVRLGEWLLRHDIDRAASPYVVTIDGTPILTEEWDDTIVDGDMRVAVIPVVGTPVQWVQVIQVILTVAAIVVALSLPDPVSSSAGDQDPVFSLDARRNKVKIGEPVDNIYGKWRHFPALASRPYNRYENDDQYIYLLFCIGHGSYQIGTKYVEDTDIANLQEVEDEIIQPGGTVTLFRDTVFTSAAVGNLELFAPNEPEYGEVGPFTINPAATQVDRLEVDVQFPNGLYKQRDDGVYEIATVQAQFQYRQVDDDNMPLGSWELLEYIDLTLSTDNVIRRTYFADVVAARYEIKASRLNVTEDNYKLRDRIVWEAAKGYAPNNSEYGDVTMWAVKAKATDNLNDNSSNRWNLNVQRLLETYDPETGLWSERIVTRSPIWAAVDMAKAQYGARMPNNRIDLAKAASLAATLDAREEYFDWNFNIKSTFWADVKQTLRAGYVIPQLQGTVLTFVRDQARTLPVATFNRSNMKRDSFEWEISSVKEDAHDGVEITYTDENTWERETLICTIGDDPLEPENPEQINLVGVINRDKAYRAGLRLRLSRRQQTEQVKFVTGVEGFIPQVGSLCAIYHDVPLWVGGGRVLSVSGNVVTLDTAVTCRADAINRIMFRNRYGELTSPYDVIYQEGATYAIETVSPVDVSALDFDDLSEPPLFILGDSAYGYGEHMLLTSATPSGRNEVELTFVNYVPEMYQQDGAVAPPLAVNENPVVNVGAPVPSYVTIRRVSSYLYAPKPYMRIGLYRMAWPPNPSATGYVLRYRRQGIDTDDTIVNLSPTTLSYEVHLNERYTGIVTLLASVAAVGRVGVGPAVEAELITGPDNVPLSVTAGEVTWGTSAIVCRWDYAQDTETYNVYIYEGEDDTGTLLRTVTDTTYDSFVYDIQDARDDGLDTRSVTFYVEARNSKGASDGKYALTAYNLPPVAPTTFSNQAWSLTPTTIEYRLLWEQNTDIDFNEYRVYGSTFSGFTPSGANLLGIVSSPSFALTLAREHPDYYIVIGVNDKWISSDVQYSDEFAVVYTEGYFILVDDEDNILSDDEGNDLVITIG